MTRATQLPRNWPARAVQFAELVPSARLHPAALACAERSRNSTPWAVALSGGADSVALMLLLWAHWPERRDRLVALHFNHRLRGRASDADARFCAQLCTALGVRFEQGAWRRATRAKVSEAAARAAREKFFAQRLAKLGAKLLWVAHHQDDVAETMLMRLARGSGTAGLAAPRPVSAGATVGCTKLRPLLGLKKAELTAALETVGAKWREDRTNAEGQFFRNRVRLSVLPTWTEAAGRDVAGGVALSRERLQEDDEALETWLAQLAPLHRGKLDLEKLRGYPLAIWRRAVHRWLLAVPVETDLSRVGFEQLLAAVRRGVNTRFSLGRRDFAVVHAGKLMLQRAKSR